MPLQNRVTPFSTIEAVPHRGLFMGNRGRLHDDHRRLVTTGWRSRAWLICLLEFRGRHRTVMAPRRYTELFFLDEAVALAAGHRPCAECRRPAFRAFMTAWAGTSRASTARGRSRRGVAPRPRGAPAQARARAGHPGRGALRRVLRPSWGGHPAVGPARRRRRGLVARGLHGMGTLAGLARGRCAHAVGDPRGPAGGLPAPPPPERRCRASVEPARAC